LYPTGSATVASIGFSFTGNGFNVTQARFRIRADSAAVSNVTAYIYNTTNTGTPDSILATSNSITLTSTVETWTAFNFTSGLPTQIGVRYIIVLTSSQPYTTHLSFTAYRVNPSFRVTSFINTNGSWSLFEITLTDTKLMAEFEVLGTPPTLSPDSYSYTFVNAGYDSTVTGSGSISVSLIPESGTIVSTVIPSGGQFIYTGALVAASWNFSSALNLTRTIEFLPTDGTATGVQVFPLFMADPDFIIGVYLFNVVDYTSSVQWIEARLGTVLIERRNVALSGIGDFSLFKGLQYTITVSGVKGSFSQSFLAGNTYSSNLIVLEGSFDNGQNTGGLPVFSVSRTQNNTAINLFFNADSTEYLLSDFSFEICKKVGTSEFIVASGGTNSMFYPFNYTWLNAEPDIEYIIHARVINSISNVTLKSWKVNVGINNNVKGTNPWSTLLTPFAVNIETLPGSFLLPTGFDIGQFPAAIFLGLVLAIFSFASHGKGCILCWVLAFVMVGLGWFVVSLPAFGLALAFSIFILFIEGKQVEREL